MKRFAPLVLVLLVVTVVGFWVTSIATLTLYPTKDTYSWQSVPEANNGFSDNFEITSANIPPNNMRGWVAFDIRDLPTDALVLRAQLQLRVWAKSENDPSKGFGDSTGRIYGVYRLTQDWQEMGLNWINQPNYTEEHHAISTVPSGQAGWNGPLLYMNWDLTDMVRDWQSGVPNYGVVVRDTQENSPILYSTQFFTHNQVPNQSYFPELIVTYVRPQSLLLFGGIFLVEIVAIAVLWRMRSNHADIPRKE
jgi:hypothetical protein